MNPCNHVLRNEYGFSTFPIKIIFKMDHPVVKMSLTEIVFLVLETIEVVRDGYVTSTANK